ncbi:5'-methylthioadenosine/S-adenosylhomocysteine nucleosidase family protein [Actinoplanes regularis]|uniref:Adenosylhomocysteine nucleosidase n=1 Tax=Actinoplanes regularis TaxID=52697 RepID=A0A238Y2H5_9ACTN|nr:5'-methylthioadenosine/S-adenosylhomocysteine nucleosidase [Actinoplanes regularis]GIE86232.1 purine phosphorylase [Actinoplanes regularis]SNR65486.1 adenosylhomocysteine nucleosidase [Actinoplanes regularis]
MSGTNNIGGSVYQGEGNTYHNPVGRDQIRERPVVSGSGTAGASTRADIGVLTVLEQETRAVVAALQGLSGYRTVLLPSGATAYEAELTTPDGRVLRIAAMQILSPGLTAAALDHRTLVERYSPEVILLVGIAGGVSDRLRIGDVVIADEIISYDARKETPDGTRRRGRAQTVAAPLGRRLNTFRTAAGSDFTGPDGVPFRLHVGPIGSGNAVVADAQSEIRTWLHTFHDKVLAVETEAAGVAEAFHDQRGPYGWLTIRGISDLADTRKPRDDAFHDLASRHAATVMIELAAYLGSR